MSIQYRLEWFEDTLIRNCCPRPSPVGLSLIYFSLRSRFLTLILCEIPFIILIMPIDQKDSSEWDSDIRQEICSGLFLGSMVPILYNAKTSLESGGRLFRYQICKNQSRSITRISLNMNSGHTCYKFFCDSKEIGSI